MDARLGVPERDHRDGPDHRTPGNPEGDRLRAVVEGDVNNVVYFRVHEGRREMKIVKMEATDHPLDWLPFNITKDGLVL